MSPNTCPFCEQVNPAEAKFCYACGGALHLVPCPRCGAVSDVSATKCYQCNGPLGARRTSEADLVPPPAEAPQPSSRPRPAALVAAVALAAVVVLGYYGYRQSSLVVVAPQPAASSSVGPAAGSAPAKSAESAQPALPIAAPLEVPAAERAPAEDTEPRAESRPEKSRRPNAAAGQIARPRGGGAGQAPGQAPQRKEVCTQAVEALGLCTMTSEERKQAESVAALKAASARPGVADSGKSGLQEPPRQEACGEAVAALGLCTPAPTRRGE